MKADDYDIDAEPWWSWLATLFPERFTHRFAVEQCEFWEWLWAIKRGQRPRPFVGIWPRGWAKSTAAEAACVALGARGFRYALYVSMTQDQADTHVDSVAAMLEGARMEAFYPELNARKVNKYGYSEGWKVNRLRTRAGFTIDAIGLDKAARGLRIEENRPDVVVLDDIDSETDLPGATDKKLLRISTKVLPAAASHAVVIGMQNLIHASGVFARLASTDPDTRTDILADRIVSGPVPAVRDLQARQTETGWEITGGEPTWGGMDLEACAAFINTYGYTSFLRECQHEMPEIGGGMFDKVDWRHCDPDEVPQLDKVVCWLDPAVTDTDASDSNGIQIDGIARDGTIYRLFSWEKRSSPERTLEMALRKASEFGAIKLGIEDNQGKDLWRLHVEQAEKRTGTPHLHYEHIHASSGMGSKATRAQRMLADYENGRIVHVRGTHTVLERALFRFPVQKPYDLVDAAYYAWADLRRGGKAKLSHPGAVPIPRPPLR